MIANPQNTRRAIYAVIPAYNEGNAIADVVRECQRYVDHVVVVDDASADDTAASASLPGVDVLRHPINLGQGAALQTGLAHALARGATHVATLDADGQHDPSEVDRLINALDTSGAQVALGSRFLGAAVGIPAHRRVVLRLAVVFTRVTTGLRVTDCHNGFRVFTADAARQVRILQNRMAHASELLEEIARKRIAYVEVPVTIRYTEYSLAKGQSSFNSLNILLDLFLHWLRK